MNFTKKFSFFCSSFFVFLWSLSLFVGSVFASVIPLTPVSFSDCGSDGDSCTSLITGTDLDDISVDDDTNLYTSSVWPDSLFEFGGTAWENDDANPYLMQFNFESGITGYVTKADLVFDGYFNHDQCGIFSECRFKFLSLTGEPTSSQIIYSQDNLVTDDVLRQEISLDSPTDLDDLSVRLLAYGTPDIEEDDPIPSGIRSVIDQVRLDVFVDDINPTLNSDTWKKNGHVISQAGTATDPAYISDLNNITFDLDLSDTGDAISGLDREVFVIYEEHPDNPGTPYWNGQGGLAYCSWNGTENSELLNGEANQVVTDLELSRCHSGILPDGRYVVAQNLYDKAGNLTGGTLLTFVFDGTSPTQPTIVSPENNLFTNVNQITVEWVGGDDQGDVVSGIEGYYIRYEFTPLGGGSITEWNTGLKKVGNPHSHSGIYGHGEGTYVIYVKTTDLAGNESLESEPLTVTYDTTPPIVTLNSPSAGLVKGQVIISGSVSDPHINYYRVIIHNDQGDRVADTGKQFITTNITSATLYNWDTLQAGGDGDYKIILITEDILANRTTLTRDVVVDNTAPSQPTGLQIIDHSGAFLGCGGFTNDRHITIDWDNNPEPDIAYYLLDLKDKDAHKSLTDSIYSAHIRDLDGLYKYKIRAVDNAGNIGQSSDWCEVILDREVPSIPGIPFSLPNPTKSTSQNWLWTASTDAGDAGISGYYQNIIDVLGGSDSGWLPLGDVLGSTTNLTEGEWKLQIKAEDNAGNQGDYAESDSLIVDTTKPVITWVNPSNGDKLKAPVLLQAHTNEPLKNLRFKWKLAGGVWESGHNINLIDTDYSWDFTPTDDGIYTLRAQGRDLALNWNKATDIEVLIDNTRPTGKILTPLDGQFTNQDFTVSGWVSDNLAGIEKVEVRLRNYPGNTFRTPWQSATLDPLNNYSSQINVASIPDDNYEVAVVAYDQVGNNKWLYPRPVITLDTVNPTVQVTSPLDGEVISGTTAVTVDANDSTSGIDRVELSYRAVGDLTGVPLCTLTSSPYTCNWDTTGLPLGNYELMARAHDLAGNFSDSDIVTIGVAAVISNEIGTTPAFGQIYISWFTDRPTTAQVVYDIFPHPIPDPSKLNYGYAYATSIFDLSKTTFHETLLTGLDDMTTYYYRLISAGSPAAVSAEMSNRTFSASGPGSSPSSPAAAAPSAGTVLGAATFTSPSVLGVSTTNVSSPTVVEEEEEEEEVSPTPSPTSQITPSPTSAPQVLGLSTNVSPLYFLIGGLLISLVIAILLFRRQ